MVRPIRALGTASYAAVLAGALLTVGCFDPQTVDPGKPPRPSTPVQPDAHGWVIKGTNELGIYGVWYSYGDQYADPHRCTGYGMHPRDVGEHNPDECSFVAWPDAEPALEFPNEGGSMCAYGNAAKVNDCLDGVDCIAKARNLTETIDYASIWGAGIGLDFALQIADGEHGGPPATRDVEKRTTWRATDYGAIGVSFDLRWLDASVHPNPYLRVEFPVALPPEGLEIDTRTVLRDDSETGWKVWDEPELAANSTSEEHPSGSPFADAPAPPTDWGPNDVSNVSEGHNEILWSRVIAPPHSHYQFDPTLGIYGILFQVPTTTDGRAPYAFCVDDFAFLTE